MILGAQFYSLRNHTQTAEEIGETFRRCREIGYDAVQLSAIGPIPAETLSALSRQYALPVTCTHSPLDRILHDTDALIAEHKTYGCTEIGLGWMQPEYRTSLAALRAFIADLREPVEKIRRAGMTFAYHNHNFEFEKMDDGRELYDVLIEETDWNFIPDTYWMTYAGKDPVAYIRKLKGRIMNIHFKDMKTAPTGPICACGNGVIDFAPIIAACEECGIRYALVEQDNANEFVTETEDEFTQMAISAKHLRPLIYRNK